MLLRVYLFEPRFSFVKMPNFVCGFFHLYCFYYYFYLKWDKIFQQQRLNVYCNWC